MLLFFYFLFILEWINIDEHEKKKYMRLDYNPSLIKKAPYFGDRKGKQLIL